MNTTTEQSATTARPTTYRQFEISDWLPVQIQAVTIIDEVLRDSRLTEADRNKIIAWFSSRP